MAKKPRKTAPKSRSMVALAMRLRYANGRGAGPHTKKGYTRKKKHKGKDYDC